MRGAVFVAREWLPYTEGLHVSNMPLKAEEMARYCERHYGNDRRAEERVIRLPDEMLAAWRKVGKVIKKEGEPDLEVDMDGPWDVFGPGKRWPLSGTHIAIDEAHLYIPKAGNVAKRYKWKNWLREIGHHGATVEFITQNLAGMDKEVETISELRCNIVSRVSDRDPILKIPMADWYELKGKIVGEWRPWIQQFEYRRIDKGWSKAEAKMAELRPEFFRLYESFSRPQTEEGESSEAVHVVEHEFQRRTWPSLLWWFARRNGDKLVVAVVCFFGVLWLCFGGGLPTLLLWGMGFIKTFANGNKGEVVEPKVNAVSAAEVGKATELSESGAPGELPAGGKSDIPEGFAIPLETVVWSGPEGDVTVEDFNELIGDRAFLETENAVQEQELELLRKEAGAVILMTEKHVTFASGERVRVGDKIERSGKDVYVTAIAYQNREVLLSDGSVVGLRMSTQRGSAGVFTRVQGGGGGSGDAGEERNGRRRDRNVGDDGGGGNPDGGNDAGVGSGDRGEHNLGRGTGQQPGQPGSSGGAPRRGPGAHSETAGGRSEPGGEPILSGPVDG